MVPAFLVLLVSFGVYQNTLDHGFTWDDDWLIISNPRIADPTYPHYMFFEREKLWRPLKRMSFMADYAEFGPDDPGGYHLTNVLFQTAVCLALYLVAHALFKRRWPAALVALLFAVHPVHVEAVANIAHRKEPMALLFFLLGLLAWIHARGNWLSRWGRPVEVISRVVLFAFAGACFLAGMLSKEVAIIMLPVMAIFWEAFFGPQRRFFHWLLLWPVSFILQVVGTPKSLSWLAQPMPPREDRKDAYWPAVGLAFQSAVVLLFMSRGYLSGLFSRWGSENVAWATGSATDSGADLGFTILKAFGAYVTSLVWPSRLYLDRDFPVMDTLWDAQVLFGLVLLLLYFAFLVWSFKHSKLACFALLWYGLNLLPVSNVIPLTHWMMAERFIYVPSVGWALLVAMGLTALWDARLPRVDALLQRRIAGVLAPTLLLSLAWLTVQQNKVWENSTTLWEHTLQYNKRSHRGLHGLGLERDKAGRQAEAEELFREAIKVDSGYPEPRYALALMLLNQKRYDEAIEHATIHARMDSGDPEPFMVIGNSLLYKKDYAGSAAAYEKAIKRSENHVDAHYNLGNALMADGKHAESLEVLLRARRLRSNDCAIARLTGQVAASLRDWEQSCTAYADAVRNCDDVEEGLRGLGACQYNLKRFEEAAATYKAYVKLRPQAYSYWNYLATCLSQIGHFPEAIEALENSLAIKGDQPDVFIALDDLHAALARQRGVK